MLSRKSILTLLALLAASLATPTAFASSISFERSDNPPVTLQELATGPRNLLLIVREQEALTEAFRWLTLPEHDGVRIHVVIATPSDSVIHAKAIRLAAQRLIRSDFSKRRVLFADHDSLSQWLSGYGLPPETKALALRSDLHLLWSSTHPLREKDLEELAPSHD